MQLNPLTRKRRKCDFLRGKKIVESKDLKNPLKELLIKMQL